MKKIFDDIRPYYDSEIPEAMKRIADSPMLSLVASYVYPNKQLSEIKEILCGFKTTRDFQHGVMYDVNKQTQKRRGLSVCQQSQGHYAGCFYPSECAC